MKKIKTKLKVLLTGGQANPGPPLGPTLAQHGINIAEFCKQVNEKTKEYQGMKIGVEITVYEDRSFSFVVKKPPVSALLKKAAGIEKGSGLTGKEVVATLTLEQIKKIAEEKLPDLNTQDLNQAIKIVLGTARSMGIEVKNE